jgi:hypothetical protein
MKATRAHLLGEFIGTLDDLIYYRSRFSGRLLVRRRWKCKNHPTHPRFRNVQQALYALNVSEGFKQDLRHYLYLFNRLPENENCGVRAWNNLYLKMMYAMQKMMPEQVDLLCITRTQIEEQDLPCRTVARAIEAGLLPMVRDFSRFKQAL